MTLTAPELGLRRLLHVDEERGQLWVEASEEPTETQIYRVPLAGGEGGEPGEAQPLNQPFETALRVRPPAETGLDLEPGVRITYTTVNEPFAQHVETVRVCVAPPSAP